MKEHTVLKALHTARSFNKYIFSELVVSLDAELNRTQRGVLMFIAINGPVPMNEVSEKFALEKGSFTQVADSLEKLLLIERHRCDKDRRIIYLKTTEKGMEIANKIHQATNTRIETIIGRLPDNDKESFLNCLKQATEYIDIIMKGI